MTPKIEFKKGDLVLYDKFGSCHETVAPSMFVDDFAIGVILNVIEEKNGGFENSFAEIMKEDGSMGSFSLSYLSSFDQS
jgi:hypothetical protein